MKYTEAIEYLNGFANLERSALDRSARAAITLQSVRELAQRLGNPQDRVPSIHVAGTKGKGSTCAFAAAILRGHGLRVGLYVSPHLEDIRERISINGEMIPEADFARILSGCVAVLEDMRNPQPGRRKPTYFEVLTHLCFTWFAEQKVDAAAIEVGLGGRLDATNIVVPEVCGIANISYDHTAILGETLTLIAREKAGIFKPGIPAVSAPQDAEAETAIRAAASEIGAPLERIGVEIHCGEAPSDSSEEWSLPRAWARMPVGTEYRATLGLRGRHQIENWALAVRLAEIFYRRRRNESLSQEAVAQASREVVWPGRLERVEQTQSQPHPEIYLDGAHNAKSLETVLDEIHTHLKRKPMVCVFGCARDKDISGMLKILARPDCGPDEIIFTDSGNPRGCTPAELAEAFGKISSKKCSIYDANSKALRQAVQAAGANGVVLVTGSLYLVGNMKLRINSLQ